LAKVNATGLCEVRSGTDAPCSRPAATEILGVPFCGPHAREQEAYSAVGELAQAYGLVCDWEKQARSLGNGPLMEALGRIQRELDWRLAEESAHLRARRVLP
jgi:hypothetical protein